MSKKPMSVVEFLSRWLRGSTCFNKKRTVWRTRENNRFVVMKHHGHSEYVGRWSGSEWCPTWYGLYDLTQPLPDVLGGPCLWRHNGRWNNQCQQEVDAAINAVLAAEITT